MPWTEQTQAAPVLSKEVNEIPIEQILPNPYQPRKHFSQHSLQDLSLSIREYGVLQPITVRRAGKHKYELISGERRLRAAKMADLTTIPSIVIDVTEEDSAILAMIENLQRENLHYLEEARGYQSLIRDHNLTQEDVAQRLGKSQSTIANKLRVLRLPQNIKDDLVKYRLSERHARALLRLPDFKLTEKVLAKIIEHGYTVKETERAVERILVRLNQETEWQRQRKRLLKQCGDMRVFINTIRDAVQLMKKYGISPEMSEQDLGDSIEIRVRIPKK
jgi:ParB family chromosome partitioning protein